MPKLAKIILVMLNVWLKLAISEIIFMFVLDFR